MNRYPGISDENAANIVARRPFTSPQMVGYLTPGGTYILGSGDLASDSGKSYDLLAVTALDVVLPLRFNANPEPIDRILSDAARAMQEERAHRNALEVPHA